jgi:MtrB/PioB family decaheme-associated outer membrane protein
MNRMKACFPPKRISVAVRSALLLMCLSPVLAAAQAVDMSDEVKELVYPTSFFELGALVIDQSSTKYGEYNGLNESGPYVLANFEVHGGSGYGMGDGTTRVDASGTDLGTNSRNVGININDQGQWNFGVDYDQLRHYTTDGYQTPYQGAIGTSNFPLLPSFGVINTTTGNGSQSLTPTQLGQFHGEDVYNDRDTATLSAGYMFSKELNFQFKYERLDQSGAKLTGAATDAYNLSSSGGFNYGGQRISILMNPTDSSTDTFNLSLNWVGPQAWATLAYYASLYHDDVSGLSWSNPFVSGGSATSPVPPPGAAPNGAFPTSTQSTPPSNDLNQFSLTGGYIFDPAWKLVGGVSYARNDQNASYDGTYTTVPNTVTVLPVGSLDGRVDIDHADAKLTWQATPTLNFAAGFRYNERDNKTASYEYQYTTIGGSAGNDVVNTPESFRREQFDASGDWRINSTNKLHFGYEYDDVHRWCNNALANDTQAVDAPANYYVLASCLQVPTNSENRAVVEYRFKAADSMNLYAGYTYGRRDADVNPSFYNPMQGTGGFENFGFLAFFDAARTENLFKAGANWQATEKFSIDFSGRYANDDYNDSALGVSNGKTESANIDANYNFTPDNSFGAYFSWQKRTRDLISAADDNAVAPPTQIWKNTLADRDNALGINGKQKGLLGGKLELNEDFEYNLGKAKYVTYLVQNITPSLGNAGEVPNISSDLKEFRINAAYQMDHHSAILAGYQYQRLKSNDYLYNAFQYGFTPNSVMPTNQVAPNYDVNAVYLAYRYSFQ